MEAHKKEFMRVTVGGAFSPRDLSECGLVQ